MGQHVHLFAPGAAITYTASAAVSAGNMVEVTGDRTVGPAGANSIKWVGTAAFDAAIGEKVTVLSGGVQKVLAASDVTAGDLIVCAASGKVATLAAVTTPTAADVTNTRAIVGVALTSVDVSEVTDDRIQVKFER